MPMTEDRGSETFAPARLLEALGHAVVATDAAGVVRYWNDAAQRLYGWTASEALGVHLHRLIGAGTLRSFAAEVMAVVRSGGQWSGGLQARSKHDSPFPVLVTNSAIHDEQGRLVGIVSVSTDLGSAVRPLLARFGGASLLVDRGAAVRFVSPVATALLGWRESELVGRSVLELIHPDDVDAFGQRLGLGRRGAPVASPVHEFRMRTRDGRWCWVDAGVADMHDDPAVGGLIVTLRDVSESRAALDRLRELGEQLETTLRTRAVLEQAKGALAQRLGVDPEQALGWLRTRASRDRRPVDDVAAEVVAGLGPAGDTPGPAGDKPGPTGDKAGPLA